MPNLDATDLRPFIPAQDFALSQRFYTRLGWATRVVGPGLALVHVSERQHFYLQDYYVREVAENSMLHLTVSDAQAWYAHVVERIAGQPFGAARVQPPKLQDYGALVTFVHDSTGVLLHLCEWRDAPGNAPGPIRHRA